VRLAARRCTRPAGCSELYTQLEFEPPVRMLRLCACFAKANTVAFDVTGLFMNRIDGYTQLQILAQRNKPPAVPEQSEPNL
jgi:hypothetical protein